MNTKSKTNKAEKALAQAAELAEPKLASFTNRNGIKVQYHYNEDGIRLDSIIASSPAGFMVPFEANNLRETSQILDTISDSSHLGAAECANAIGAGSRAPLAREAIHAMAHYMLSHRGDLTHSEIESRTGYSIRTLRRMISPPEKRGPSKLRRLQATARELIDVLPQSFVEGPNKGLIERLKELL